MWRDRARRESEKMYLTGSPWRWCTVSCGYLSRWYGVRQWEGGRVTGPRRYRLALPHSNRWDYARCCRWSMMLWLVGRSSPRFVVDRGSRDGDDGRRRFDRANRAFWSTVYACQRLPDGADRERRSRKINKETKQAEHSRGVLRQADHERRRTLSNSEEHDQRNSFWQLGVCWFQREKTRET